MQILTTQRLILRTWTDDDLQPMYDLNQDPKVMEHFPGLQDLAATKQLIANINHHFEQYGYSLCACVRKDTNEFIGFIGLFTATFAAPFTPATEIGWRLAAKHWGQGLATEGAKAVLDYAFTELQLPEIVSFTPTANVKSRHVMEKIGLRHNAADDFDKPNLEDYPHLQRHVLYRLTKAQYTEQ